ncbi:uncharacterized protein LOC121053046 isoform X1 [Rosa chinensis]|uniref:uncharacterized protein LOC121053046 isoform X1 n=1 Tax=Rosa chinensis TaxID=74649 RepID=UPI001AD8E4B0|nr:uncharacterized protein LOC121053046 isoform X1 [Rosa chinensis]XP_040375297.1 uncharacterized protein LOC121053046 isoform X1 [Rosa chinensis]
MDLEHGRTSKLPDIVIEEITQPETPVRVPDRSVEIKQSETTAKVPDRSGEIKQSETPLRVPDGSGEIKQSETPAKVPDGSGEIKKSETPAKVPDGSGESKQSETLPKVNDGRPSPAVPSKVVEATAKGGHRRAPSETLPDVNDGNGGSKHPSSPSPSSKVVEATAKRGHWRGPSGTLSKVNDGSGGSKHSSSPLISSKVAEATAKGGHQRVPSDKLLSFTSTSSSGSDTSMDDLFQVDSNRFSTSTHIPPLPKDYGPNSPYRPSTSRASNVTNGLPTESPAVQMMERYGGYDPYRIPSSVFDTSNVSNKEILEWSAASNESLFSLHLGNSSFSRDHILMLSDLGPTKSSELLEISPRTPPPVVETEMSRIEEGRESAAEEVADANIKDTEHASAENHSEGRVPPAPKSPSLAHSRHSDGSGLSGTSTRSFAFPMYVYIYDLSLTDGTKNSLKLPGDSEEQRPEPPPPPASRTKKSKKKKTRWLPCFSCSWCKWGCCCSCRRLCSCPRFFRRCCCCC